MSVVRFLVSGQVQGVGFRWFVARHARQLGLAGYARNLGDGGVEVVVTGEGEAVAELEALLRRGPAHARVETVDRAEPAEDTSVPQRSFDIR
ncbi:MAG TPA: acylphosphatase [Gemmatimonadales bacterium]|nr:acylphosphatase [Gemmatimonadales bacterium]